MKKLILIALLSCLFGAVLQAHTPNQIKAMELMMQHYQQNKAAIDKRADQLLAAFCQKQRLSNPAAACYVDPTMCVQLAILEPFIYKALQNCKEFQNFIDSIDCFAEYQSCGKNAFTYGQYKVFNALEFLSKNKEIYAREYSLFKKLMDEDLTLLVIKKYSSN